MAMKKVIIEMIENIPGGKSAVAGFLGFSEAELNNRLYQTKGQRFKDEELIAIQNEFGLTDYTDELCRIAGGAFVKVPPKDALDNTELSCRQVSEIAARGLLYSALDQAMKDGEITAAEEDKIRSALSKHLSATVNSIELTIALYKRQ
ncbi:YmfL family putative regulatory protein [Mannheimia massilioguelmaensis]|uniref:YmfL family putative regulatory protein n=1 Tax=Mannheimia massilioguelmaensis TaxID=1604354 RepID=UPI0005CA992D|nr:YmfL family putative regulatory protein [Mannheimia massilioguelmaensis]